MSPKRRRRPRPISEQQWSPSPTSGLDPVEIEVDLHGLRVHEAIPVIEDHLQRCYDARLHICRINHGQGTGALKQVTNELLSKSALVARHYPAAHGDGNDGMTIAELDYGGHRAFNRRANNSIVPKPLPRK